MTGRAAAAHDTRAPCGTAEPWHRDWFDAARFPEPTLRELLDDPLVRALMRSDGVAPGELAALVTAIGKRWHRTLPSV